MHYYSKIVNCDFGFIFVASKKPLKINPRFASDAKHPSHWIAV